MNRQLIFIAGAVIIVVLALVVFLNRRNSSQPSVSAPVAVSEAKKLYEEAVRLEASGQKLEAKAIYQKVVNEFSDFDQMEAVQTNLGNINLGIILSNMETPNTEFYEVKPGDSLGKISKQYGTTIELIKQNNGLSNDVIRAGQRLRIWKGKFSIFVDKSQNILILKSANEVVKVYNVSTGLNNSTPVGKFKITSKIVDPVWFKSGAVVPPESPANVLGTRWMGFDIAGYGIHGTTEPDKIGQQVTAGCVRMRNEEVEELYTLIPMGTEVVIQD
ncbi:MAG: L,D-transpeptidase family protein [Candidatus Omnitrophica bacterium]|nr:L,D-transpeptidase family protein [Candidatus Omnitrophota bacterium]